VSPTSARRASTDEIYRDLRERIVLLDLPPGSRLTETGLAGEYGVSRTPIRQVLDRLEYDRLVDQGQSTGTRVSIVDTKEIRDIWVVRLKIAELLGEFVHGPAPDALIGRLRRIREELENVRTSRNVRTMGSCTTATTRPCSR
jgi:DNA-binding GntR family transcriptional regulator